MCINVQLPVMTHFLLLYSLRCGSTFVVVWTTIRSFASLLFFVTIILETFVKRHLLFGPVFVHTSNSTTDSSAVYYSMSGMVIVEAILFYHTFYLMIGIYDRSANPFQAYLPCRFITWLLEIIFLFTLCITHRYLIGWYLIILMVIILEIYCFVIVYSYYRELLDCPPDPPKEEEGGVNFCDSYQ